MSTTETDAGPSDLPRWAGAIEVNDDSCAFHVRVLPRCTANARELSLAVQLSSLQSGNLVAGANPYVLVFEGLTHLAPPSGTKMTETTPGPMKSVRSCSTSRVRGPSRFISSERAWKPTARPTPTCRCW